MIVPTEPKQLVGGLFPASYCLSFGYVCGYAIFRDYWYNIGHLRSTKLALLYRQLQSSFFQFANDFKEPLLMFLDGHHEVIKGRL